jgi:serine/threonine protein kinase
MRLRCPHCHNPVEVEPGPLGTLECSNCRRTIPVNEPVPARPDSTEPPTTIARSPADPGASGVGQAISDRPRLGSYVIVGEIGRGGMGRVYKAVHTTLRQVRALKVLGKKESSDPKLVARFQREARIVAQLDHPHIVKIFEFDQDADHGHYYIVMEMIDGGPVSRILRKQGRLPWQQAAEITLQIALGLAEMNKHGLVHRDIKPSNILIDRQGTAKLADLGLARHESDGVDTQLTATGAVMGTIDYMAPEQIIDSRKADIRSDLYALGCTLFHMLSGQVPFPDGSAYQKIQQQINDPLPEVGPLAPDVPFQVVLILNRLTEKDPNNRYQSPLELISDLQTITGDPTPIDDLAQSTILQLQALAEAVAKDRSSTSLATGSGSSSSRTIRELGGSPVWLLVGVAAAAVMTAVLWFFVFWFGGDQPERPAATARPDSHQSSPAPPTDSGATPPADDAGSREQ